MFIETPFKPGDEPLWIQDWCSGNMKGMYEYERKDKKKRYKKSGTGRKKYRKKSSDNFIL